MKLRMPKWTEIIRVAGLGIILYETIFERADRPSLLILAAGMIGLHSVAKAQNGSVK